MGKLPRVWRIMTSPSCFSLSGVMVLNALPPRSGNAAWLEADSISTVSRQQSVGLVTAVKLIAGKPAFIQY